MKTVRDWNAYVVRQRMSGTRVDLSDIIMDYVTRYQRVKWTDIVNYVYKKIGSDYRSAEFNAYIAETVTRLERNKRLVKENDYYICAEGETI